MKTYKTAAVFLSLAFLIMGEVRCAVARTGSSCSVAISDTHGLTDMTKLPIISISPPSAACIPYHYRYSLEDLCPGERQRSCFLSPNILPRRLPPIQRLVGGDDAMRRDEKLRLELILVSLLQHWGQGSPYNESRNLQLSTGRNLIAAGCLEMMSKWQVTPFIGAPNTRISIQVGSPRHTDISRILRIFPSDPTCKTEVQEMAMEASKQYTNLRRAMLRDKECIGFELPVVLIDLIDDFIMGRKNN